MKRFTTIRKHRKVRKPSWRWEIVDGAYQKFPDGREVCLRNAKGQAEYRRRTVTMAARQGWVCGICLNRSKPMNNWSPEGVTFQHGAGRGMGGAHRDDRIDSPRNCAAHWDCNTELGSRRISTDE